MTIAELNDQHRRHLMAPRGGRTMLTRGVAALPPSILGDLLYQVVTFDAFRTENDPHHEHDFGRVEAVGVEVFWKFDYFADDSLTSGADTGSICYRVLTLMLTEEY